MTASSRLLIYRISQEVIFMLHSSSTVQAPHPLSTCSRENAKLQRFPHSVRVLCLKFYKHAPGNAGNWMTGKVMRTTSAILSSLGWKKHSMEATQTKTRHWGRVKRHITHEWMTFVTVLERLWFLYVCNYNPDWRNQQELCLNSHLTTCC